MRWLMWAACQLVPMVLQGAGHNEESVDDQDIYRLVGEDGLSRLVAEFYRRIPGDDILGPMYPKEDLKGAEERLRGFLIFRFGGPQTYIAERGHPRLRMRHAPFAIDRAARDRWMKLMGEALDEMQFPEEIDRLMREFFGSVATFMMNREQGPLERRL
ncbi:MAG TPA: globin [Bryobacteraceae bacterium]|nr:globin [Bryobacteraceae bacterium]